MTTLSKMKEILNSYKCSKSRKSSTITSRLPIFSPKFHKLELRRKYLKISSIKYISMFGDDFSISGLQVYMAITRDTGQLLKMLSFSQIVSQTILFLRFPKFCSLQLCLSQLTSKTSEFHSSMISIILLKSTRIKLEIRPTACRKEIPSKLSEEMFNNFIIFIVVY